MRGVCAGMPEGPEDLQDCGKRRTEGGGSDGQEFLYRVYDMRDCV